MSADPPHSVEVGTIPAEGGQRTRASGLNEAGRRLFGPVALAVIIFLVVWWWFVLAIQAQPHDWAFDFQQFWQGGNDVVNGVSPYPHANALAGAGDTLDPEGIRSVFRFPYPAGAAVLLAPLGALSFHAAAAVWSALLIASMLGALWILRVRDWRVLAIVVTSAPILSSIRLGTFTPVLVLLLAVAWRWRDRKWVSGGALGAGICLKLLLWPLVAWFVASRRYAAAAIAAFGATLVTLVAWAAIGFEGLADYPELLRKLADVVAVRSLSLVALGAAVGLPRGVADLIPWIAGLGLLALVVIAARRKDDRLSFSLAVLAAIALTPIVWLHYFSLLVVPVAIYRPRFAWVWVLFSLFWLTPQQTSDGDLWRILLVDALAIGLVLFSRSALRRVPRPATA